MGSDWIVLGAVILVSLTSIYVLIGRDWRYIIGALAASILLLTISSLVLHSESWLSMISIPIRWGSFVMMGFGLLQISLTNHPLRVIIGLLTFLSGFEIIYAAIEKSTLVTGLLAGVNLGLALVGAYILIAPSMENNP